MKVPLPWSNNLPKVLPPNTITFGIKGFSMNFVVTKTFNIQLIAHVQKNLWGAKDTRKVFDQCTYCGHKIYDERVFTHKRAVAVCQCGLLLLYIYNSSEPLLCDNKNIHHVFNPSDASGAVSFFWGNYKHNNREVAFGKGMRPTEDGQTMLTRERRCRPQKVFFCDYLDMQTPKNHKVQENKVPSSASSPALTI